MVLRRRIVYSQSVNVFLICVDQLAVDLYQQHPLAVLQKVVDRRNPTNLWAEFTVGSHQDALTYTYVHT